MSQVAQSTTETPEAKIEANRDSLEALADSNLPCAEVAKALLEIAEREE
jgi:hypothetical protein